MDNITFRECINKNKHLLIIPIFEELLPKLEFNSTDYLSEENLLLLSQIFKEEDFKGKFLQKFFINGNELFEKILILGLGKAENLQPFDLKNIFCQIIKSQLFYVKTKIAILTRHLSEEKHIYKNCISKNKQTKEYLINRIPCEIAFGIILGNYKFEKYLQNKKEKNYEIEIESINEEWAKKDFINDLHILDGIFLTRNLGNEPSNVLTPKEFTKRCKELENVNVKVKVLNEKEIEKLQMNALLSVGKGSGQQSYVVIMEWLNDATSEEKIALVGKGVTFDSGGISIKPSRKMEKMIFDMCGAATVCGTLLALAKRKVKTNVIGIIGLVENMPSGSAMKPGDIIKSLSGKTIEITNTDAEGRLVLIDLLSYIQKEFKTKVIVDLATLTGSICVALGSLYSGIFSPNKIIGEEIKESGWEKGEKAWLMPMDDLYAQEMMSSIADLRNSEPGYEAGSITAAKFLQEVVKKPNNWVHIDIASVASVDNNKYIKTVSKEGGATGYGVQMLVNWIEKHLTNTHDGNKKRKNS